jgi:hypothetical protein
MLKKTFILTQFGSPHPWTLKYFENIRFLEQYGWYWKIFTPNDYKSYGNIEIVPMDLTSFNHLVESKTGILPKNSMIGGKPIKPISDYYVASGLIFEDYLKGTDYWGITNWDVVYGRLDHFIPDEELQKYEIWSDDVNAINGVFSLYRNTEKINHLFERINRWKTAFEDNLLYGIDEIDFTEVMRNQTDIAFGYPKYYPLHSYDRLEQHYPEPKLEMKEDHSLWELFLDIAPRGRQFMGREIPYFHFSFKKTWPIFVS